MIGLAVEGWSEQWAVEVAAAGSALQAAAAGGIWQVGGLVRLYVLVQAAEVALAAVAEGEGAAVRAGVQVGGREAMAGQAGEAMGEAAVEERGARCTR